MKKRYLGNKLWHGMTFLILFFAVCSISLLSGGQNVKAETEGFWNYYNTTGGVKISQYTGDMQVVVIPSTLGGKAVVALSDQAFSEKKNMHTVTIPSTVRRIDSNWSGCFKNCESLMTVNGLENVTYIGENAFRGCVSLENLNFSNDLTYIGNNAFENTSLKGNISFPDSLETIEEYAFSGCEGITSVTVPEKVTELGSGAFKNCTELITADIKGACDIGTDAFRDCTSLQSVTTSSLVKGIRQGAFYGDTALEHVNLENGIRSIGSDDWQGGAFYGCTGLKTIHIPESVRIIDEKAFNGCTALTTVSLNFGLLEIHNNAFDGCSVLNEVNIPNSVVKIEEQAFRNCISLTSITIPNSVTISDGSWSRVFSGCNNVTVSGYTGSKVEQYIKSGENGLDNLEFVPLTTVLSTDFTFGTELIEMKRGEMRRIAYTMEPSDSTDAVAWESSDTSKVLINQLGEITAKNAGMVTITATTTSGIQSFMTVKVALDPSRVSFSTWSKTISIGQSYTQAAKVYDDNGLRPDILPTYESSNSAIATVDKNGQVKGLKEGVVTITARAGAVANSYTVKVVNSGGSNSNSGGNKDSSKNKIAISKLQITKKGKTLTVKTIPGASVKVNAKKSVLGKSSKTAVTNSKGVAKIKFKKKIKKVTVTVQVSKTGYITKTAKKKFKK